jgi:hypothetical protein
MNLFEHFGDLVSRFQRSLLVTKLKQGSNFDDGETPSEPSVLATSAIPVF